MHIVQCSKSARNQVSGRPAMSYTKKAPAKEEPSLYIGELCRSPVFHLLYKALDVLSGLLIRGILHQVPQLICEP